MRVVKSQLFNHYFAQFEPRQGLIDPPFHVQEITIAIREQRNGGGYLQAGSTPRGTYITIKTLFWMI